MKYEILSATSSNETLVVTTKITLNDESEMIADIAVFTPECVTDIEVAIVNRALTEQARQDKIESIKNLVPIIPIGEIKHI